MFRPGCKTKTEAAASAEAVQLKAWPTIWAMRPGAFAARSINSSRG
jgi:hypothetical protein